MAEDRREAARPLLGVVACNRTVGEEQAASVMRRYLVAAATYIDASLLIIPSLPDLIDAPRLAGMLDGLLLTGSPSNIASLSYGAEALDDGPFDHDRDEVVARMLQAMGARARPVLGICRGLQEINVALGGTLRRDLGASHEHAHHAPPEADLEAMFGWTHAVAIVPDGMLSGVFRQPAIAVNSVHYQGIERLADGLRVEATAEDGLVEAVSGQIGAAPVLAVQWHPEWNVENNPPAQALFRHFGEMMRASSLTGLSADSTTGMTDV
ncbi:gamma-glutamyl-gamma-aminobutyrate hydrolase family protein [Microvirga antarctica]|uniref:gamma-glutamyl-gamma-aminobutyrate hydrolase family protein n=1 Tax=Microvirga antarctica TaxID=2819233 RepID=UPI001B30AA6D|nr:gamma-glutamyl-gamma-aminobutyrate hydrolase family protein [Microvirga antarctica]